MVGLVLGLLEMLPLFVVCGLMEGENARSFEDSERSAADLKLLFLCTLFGWMMAMAD